MDYGCGTGLVSIELINDVNSILLVDSAKEMLEVAEGKIHQKGITNAKVLHSDFTEDHFNLKVDIILMSLVLLHIPNTRKILQQLFNMLNNNGKLIIVDFNKNHKINHPKVHNGFSQEEMKELLYDIGFQAVDIRTFYEGKQIFMKQDASMFIASSTM